MNNFLSEVARHTAVTGRNLLYGRNSSRTWISQNIGMVQMKQGQPGPMYQAQKLTGSLVTLATIYPNFKAEFLSVESNSTRIDAAFDGRRNGRFPNRH
jgi:hypothetical protein